MRTTELLAACRPRRCAALRLDGTPCKLAAVRGSDCCFWHAEERASDREQRQCTYRRPNGSPCHGTAVDGSSFCFWHSPERAGQRSWNQERRRLRHLYETDTDIDKAALWGHALVHAEPGA